MKQTQFSTAKLKEGVSDIPILNAKIGLDLELNLLQSVVDGETNADFLIWRCEQSLVVPKSFSHKANFKLTQKYFNYIGWPIVLRETGGDLTPQYPGMLNVAIVFRSAKKAVSIRDSYLEICQPIIHALSRLGINASYGSINGAFCNGDYNVTVNNKKIAGTAQRWRQIKSVDSVNQDVAILVQAAILTEGPLTYLWQICNEFYQRNDINYFIEEDKHIALNEILKESGIALAKKIEPQIIDSMEDWLDSYKQKTSTTLNNNH